MNEEKLDELIEELFSLAEENMLLEQLKQIVRNYGFYNRLPKSQDIGNALSFKPKILERKTILQRVGDKIQDFLIRLLKGWGDAKRTS
jgi:type I restriction enzyme R subunit